MDECISREAAIKQFCDDCMDREWCKSNGESCSRINNINAVPAADVRPVARAAWLTGNDNPRTYGRIRAMCGRCGAFALYEMVNAGSYKEKQSNYCPNCGADMREANDG